MPRSSRHKSSKHYSREGREREYSDSEKDPGLKEKKGKDDGGGNGSSRHVKESTSGEKRKLESKSVDIAKDSVGTATVIDEYAPSSSKKRKEKVDDDRWTGGDNEHELSKSETKEMKSASDSRRSSRRDENTTPGFDADEGKRSGSKVESKAYRSDRKERSEKEGASERARKGEKVRD
uniref:Uncharacterized protein n=1 Tax=Opuntia streptacantha TaxID=393608 RepID=A0A7C9A988_OPUST